MLRSRNRFGFRAILLVMVLAVVAAACSSGDDAETTTTAGEAAATTTSAGDGSSGSATIGFAISSFDNDFFVSLKDGVEGAAAAAGATVTISDAGGDAATQASQVEDFITQGVDLIMVNPVDSDAIVPSVEAANAAGIPVMAVDRGSSGGEVVATVASDNVLGGTMAGEYLFELMGDGEVLELQGIIGTSAAQDRGEGFQIALDDATGVTRVAQQTANFARDEGLTVTENLLQANPDATGLFAHNDDMALGAVEAAAAAGRDLIIVGFDAAPDAVQAVADGTMAGTIAQQPVLIGELAVETALLVIGGETVEAVIAVPVALVTPDNAADFGAAAAAAAAGATIGFAISSFDNDFFVSLKDGVEGAAAAAGATVTISDAGGDAATQASQVEDFITQGVDLIMVNPVDSDAIVPSVEAANAAGIPVMAVDRGSSGGEVVATVASDNVLGGTMAGEYLFELMGDGEVLELQGIIGTSAAQDRGEGFQIALDDATGVTRVAQQTANFARDEGLTVTENLLQANPDATGLFAHNDDMALGAVEAAAAAGRDLIIVGFDAAPDAVQAVADGTMAGTIAQQPVLIGELAVETALLVIGGETVEAVIAVPVALVTPDNAADFGG